MGKSAPSPPPPPDPAATAAAQAAANKETAIANANINMVNQYTPQGSLEYSQRGTAPDGTPQYSATQTLSPDQQKLYDLTNEASQKYGETANDQLDAVRGTLAKPLDFGGLGAAPTPDAAMRQQVIDSMTARQQPQMDQQRAALETRLANQGITMGSDAWKTGMDDFNRAQNDQRLAIDAQAGNEMAQQYGLTSSARNQSINELIQQRQIPLNELAAMLTGSQVQSPTFVNTPQTQVAGTDISGPTYASYNGQLQNYQTGVANKNAQTQGTMGLIGTGIMAAAMAF